jgi:outer membrane protein assembly factor BamD
MAEVRETQGQFSHKCRNGFPASARSGIRGMLAVLVLILSAPLMRHFPVSIFILLLLVLSGCASLDDDPTKGWSAQRIYTEGKTALANSEYTTAIGYFEKLEARYPYGPYAEQAMLEIAYAYYKSDEMASAIAAANRFLRTHPTHPHVDYAYYLKGLASFDEERSSLEKVFGAGDPSKRDPKALREAYDAFREVAQRFPKSKYAEDSRRRLVSLQNAMAMSELHAANYYFSRGAYVATVNRTKNVIEKYQRTPAVEDALGLQALSYRKLGFEVLMQDTRRVLEKNFPQSRYLSKLDKAENKKD